MRQEVVFDDKLQREKSFAWWLYVFHAISFLFSLGAMSWLPLILNYIKRPDTAGSFIHNHHTWQIRSFWWYLLWMGLGAILFFTIIGIPLAYVIWTLAWVWKAYRLLKGFLRLQENRPASD
ncbi:MAG: putative transrane protein [Paucimonas sp.]|jgi:uncharacterized membrane protein|nr:putative transrane protein [Paucimonas sp.]